VQAKRTPSRNEMGWELICAVTSERFAVWLAANAAMQDRPPA